MTDTHALRLLFERRRAAGVEIVRHGEVGVIEAEREIIICAGAYQSPQLLMLSGIGPAGGLRAFGSILSRICPSERTCSTIPWC